MHSPSKHLFLVVACFYLFAVSIMAAPIPVVSIQKLSDGLLLHMSPGALRLQVCSNRIVRVTYAPGTALPALKSVMVIADWPKSQAFKVEEQAHWISLRTELLSVRVDRSSGAISFLDAAGKVLLREPAGGGKSLTPTVVNNEQTFQVRQTFLSPPDESLYGLGQFQDGLWNWRGVPLELHQLNTQIELPVLISSQGYGLLWDNASPTDFNPADHQIPLQLEGNNAVRNGTFVSGAAGEYVFIAKDGNRRDELTLLVDGKPIAGVKNMWTPYSVVGKVALAAQQTCAVSVRGGGDKVKLSARPLGDTTTFRSQVGDAIDYTFFYGPELDQIVRDYRLATGEAPMWPKWAYGFWQCRERYSSQQELLAAAAEFRRRQIPLDLIVQDWQYWGDHGFGSYQWDLQHYPDPAAMIKQLHAENVKFMITVWCNPRGTTLDDLQANNALVGEWIDVFSPVGRAIRWKHLNEAFFKIGLDAWWGDATEPGDPGTDLLGKQVALGSGNRFTGAYPLFASESIYDGQRATDPNKRVCILTRSAFPGQQRYAAAVWSGDVHGNWETFARQIPAGLNFCLTGQPYWTTDTGGFFRPDNQYTSADYNELLARWFEWSTFCPILRIHGWETETEMWKWLPETQTILLAYDQLRYRMLPYNYSVAWRVTSDSYTIMRALPMDFPSDQNVWKIGHEYMFGPAFLVAPVTEPQATSKSVYLPAGTSWVNFWSGEKSDGGRMVAVAAPREQIPLFVRAGSIVPLGPQLQYAAEKPADPIELRVYGGANGAFTLYEDEGDNYNYEHGVHATIPISWSEKNQTLTIGKRNGRFPGMLMQRKFRIVLVSANHGTGGVGTEKVDEELVYRGHAVHVAIRRGGSLQH